MMRLLLVAVLLLGACSNPTPLPPVHPPTPNTCHNLPPVYHPARLKLLNACVTFKGTVLADLHEQDGDRHLWLSPDPGYEGMLNAANVYQGHKALVAEIVPACTTQPADEAQASHCPASSIKPPPVGAHVVVTGPHVLDTVHNWLEIHPVASLTG